MKRKRQIRTLIFWQKIKQIIIFIREQHWQAPTLHAPFQLELANSKDTAENHGAHAFRMRLRICESESGAPGTAEDHVPFWNLKMFAEGFNVRDEMQVVLLTVLAFGRDSPHPR